MELVVEVLCPRDDGVLDRKPLCRPPLTRTGSAVHDRDVVQGMAHTCVDCVGAAVSLACNLCEFVALENVLVSEVVVDRHGLYRCMEALLVRG